MDGRATCPELSEGLPIVELMNGGTPDYEPAGEEPITAERWPGNDELLSMVGSQVEEQAHRGDAIDTKTGLLLGFAGVLAGLATGRDRSWPADVAIIVAIGSALLATWAFFPRAYPAIAPREWRRRFLHTPAFEVRFRYLGYPIYRYEETEIRLRMKVLRLRLALGFLAAAVLFTALGAIVE